MKKLIYCIGLLSLSVLPVACNNSSREATKEEVPTIGIPEAFDYGKVENDTYRNKYFKCTMKVPTEWKIQSKETMDELTGKATDRIAGDDAELKQAVEVGKINSANLLAVSKLDMVTATEPNPNFLILVENVSSSSQITEGKDYLESARMMMQRAQVNYKEISEDFKIEVINGVDFYRMDAILSVGLTDVRQCYLATIRKEFAFVVIITYFTDEEKAFIDKYVRTLKFEKEDA